MECRGPGNFYARVHKSVVKEIVVTWSNELQTKETSAIIQTSWEIYCVCYTR